MGGDFSRVPPAPEAPPPKKRSGPSQGTPDGRKHPFPPHPPRQWEDPPERPRGEEPPSKGRSKGGKNRQSKHQARGQMTGGSDKGHTESLGGGKPHLPMDGGHPGKTAAQTGVDAEASAGVFKAVPHPAGPGCLPPCLQPGLLGVHLRGGYQEKGRRPWPGHAGRGALLDDVLHGHGGQGRIGGRWPQLQDVEHPQVVPQTGWLTAGEGQSRADLVGLRGLGAQGYGGHGQRQRAHAPPDVPDLAGLQEARPADGPAGWLLFFSPMNPMECSKSPSAARCSSIWVTRAYVQWARALHHSLIKFDECRLGQVVVKSIGMICVATTGCTPGEKSSTPVTSAGTRSR